MRALPLATALLSGSLVFAGCGSSPPTAVASDGGTDAGGTDAGTSPDAGTDAGPLCEALGTAGSGYFDPELLSTPPVAVFQDEGRTLWLARIDPSTGLFAVPSGREREVARDVPSLLVTANGAELGVDRDGPAAFFSKEVSGVLQIWRTPFGGPLDDGTSPLVSSPLTRAASARFSPLPSQDPDAPHTNVIFLRGRYADRDVGFLRDEAPDTEGSPGGVTLGVSGPRWIRGTNDFVLATPDGRIARYATDTGTLAPITEPGGGVLTDPFVARAPETGGLVLLAIEDQVRVVVFVEGTPSFTRVGEIDAPDSGFPWVYSAEPVVVGARTYVTFHAQADRVTPPTPTTSGVWLSSLPLAGAAAEPRRVDDGAPAHRIDPETLVGSDELFVYYNELPGSRAPWRFVRCRTGVGVR